MSRKASFMKDIAIPGPLDVIRETRCPVHGVKMCGQTPDPTAIIVNGVPSRSVEYACAYRLKEAILFNPSFLDSLARK